MPNRRLDWTINVNAQGAVSALNQVGTAGANAARDLADGFDQAGSASEQAIRAMTATLDKLEADSQAAAKAVAAIGEHVTIDMDEATIARFTSDLKSKFGLAFDQIEADAKGFAEVLERGVDMSKTTAEIRNVGAELDHTREGADQSRSVLANMAGNAAQDLGELGGVVGTLGVGVGQLAEYATEGNIKLSELAAVAGPMAALSAATLLLNSYMSNVAKVKAFNAEEVKAYGDAIEDVGPGVQAVNEKLRETGVISGMIEDSNPFTPFTDTAVDITAKLDEFNLSLADAEKVIADTGQAVGFMAIEVDGVKLGFHNVTPELVAFIDKMNAAGVEGHDQVDIINVLQQQQSAYRASLAESGTANDFYAATLQNINTAMLGVSNTQRQLDNNWGIIVDDLRDGTVETERAKEAWNILQTFLQLSNQEMADMAQSKLDETLAAEADAADELTAAFRANMEAAKDVQAAWDTAGATMASADFDAAGIEAAGQALADWFDATAIGAQGGPDVFNDYVEAVQGLGTALQENEGLFDADVLAGFAVTDAQRQQLAALQALGQTIMPRVTEAYDQANGNFEQFDRNVTQLSDSIHKDLVTQLIAAGVSANDAEDQANALQVALGLIPGNVSTWFKLEGDADARAKLDLLMQDLSGIPPEVLSEVRAAIIADDPQAALEALAAEVSAHTIDAPIGLDTGPANSDYWAMAGAIEGNTLTVPVQLSFAAAIARLRQALHDATGGIFGHAASSSAAAPMALGAAPAPTATATTAAPSLTMAGAGRPINVTISAGVIGNRYDVQRAVTGAIAQAERMGRL